MIVTEVFSRILIIFSDDRGHVMERSKNSRTGEEEEKQDFLNIEEGVFHLLLCLAALLNKFYQAQHHRIQMIIIIISYFS